MANQAPIVRCIVFHFGPRPRWFDWFAETLSKQQVLDVLMYADSIPVSWSTQNLTIIPCSRDVFCTRVGLVDLDSHWHRISDTRPTFGRVFAKELAGFEYWGYLDTDVIFGKFDEWLLQHMPLTTGLCSTEIPSEFFMVWPNRGPFLQLQAGNKFHQYPRWAQANLLEASPTLSYPQQGFTAFDPKYAIYTAAGEILIEGEPRLTTPMLHLSRWKYRWKGLMHHYADDAIFHISPTGIYCLEKTS